MEIFEWMGKPQKKKQRYFFMNFVSVPPEPLRIHGLKVSFGGKIAANKQQGIVSLPTIYGHLEVGFIKA